jgi:hypothetical protein
MSAPNNVINYKSNEKFVNDKFRYASKFRDRDRKNYFLDQLEKFYDGATKADGHPIQKDAGLEWQDHLGERFDCDEASTDIEDSNIYKEPSIININSNSAVNA